MYEVAISWERPKFELDSKDVMEMCINEGPLVGSILKEVEEWGAANDFIYDKFSLIERLKAICQAHK